MEKMIYLMFRKAAIPEFRNEYIKKIIEYCNLDYRTVVTLIKIINNESGITKENIEKLSDPAFYNMENMLDMAKRGFTDIIPYKFYQDSVFLEKSGITELPALFLAGCEEIKEFTILPQIRKIGQDAFLGCKNLCSVIFKGEVKCIESCAFKDCSSLKIDTFPDSVTYIGNEVFKNCTSITSFQIPDSIHQIEKKMFQNCTSLKTIYLKNPVRIKDKAFSGCDSIDKFTTTITELGEECFNGCTSLEEVRLSTATVPQKAFYECSNLHNISFEKEIPRKIKKDAFNGCASLTEITVDGFSYQLREIIGFCELTKNIHLLESSDETKLSCSILFLNSVEKVLEAAN